MNIYNHFVYTQIAIATTITLYEGEECGRASWGATSAQNLIPNTQCAEGLSCNQFEYRDHDGWSCYTCGVVQ